jgi:hypothetical protein
LENYENEARRLFGPGRAALLQQDLN